MRIFDSHAHYDDERFDGKSVELLNYLHENEDVAVVVNAASSLSSLNSSRELSESLDFVYFAAGIHPDSAACLPEGWLDAVKQAALHPKCVAVGEIGLDYYYGKDTEDIQKEVFRAQLSLASAISKPVVIHDREAHGDCLSIISEFPDVTGVFHSYSGSFEMAKELLKKGWYISFNGILTFKNARKTVEVLEGIESYEGGKYVKNILVETDCPYLAPVPFRGKTNNSGYIKYTAEKAADILGISVEDFCMITYNNACNFFGLGDKK